MPYAKFTDYSPKFVASAEYNDAITAGNVKVLADDEYERPNDRTFRVRANIIPKIWESTVMQRVSEVQYENVPEIMRGFDRHLLFERTKINPQNQDSTAKLKTLTAIKVTKLIILKRHCKRITGFVNRIETRHSPDVL